MATFDEVQQAVRARRFRVSDHGDDEMADEGINVGDVEESVLRDEAEVTEDYPNAWPFPACLVLSRLADRGPVHLVWAFERPSGYAVLVTLYRPDPARWTADFRKRVKQ